MSKHAATERTMGALHERIARVFTRILERYEAQLDKEEQQALTADAVATDIVDDLLDDGVEIDPRILSAVTKFLKDNEISFTSDEVDRLSDQERRLAERRERRGNIVALTTLSPVEEANGG